MSVWVVIRLPETLHPQDRLPIQVGRIARAFRTAATNRTSAFYMIGQMLLFGSLVGFLNSAQQVVADTFHSGALFTAVFAFAAAFLAVAALVNSRLVVRLGMRRLSHAGLLAYITLASIHLVIALSGHETLVIFAGFQAASMLAFGLTSGNFNAMAMEPMGHIAGVASSFQGLITTVGAAMIGLVIGQHFNGTVIPVVSGYLVCGLSALVAVLIAEHGRLFTTHNPAVA